VKALHVAIVAAVGLTLGVVGGLSLLDKDPFSTPPPPPPVTEEHAESESAEQLSVVREDARTFSITRPGAPSARVTFLTPTAFRIHVPGPDEPAKLPDYMRVKTDESFPPVQVHLDARHYGATFKTADVDIQVVATEDLISVNVTTASKTLVGNWKIDPVRRLAWLDLAADEHVYGFGDKRAALDQRGHKIEMLNRDAFASENNESYKSIPFYLSSAGYGLFFHNFYPSLFDIGSSTRGTLALKATAGDMDFYVFVGEPKDVVSQYTELTGRPAMLPRWAFGYHQAKASYEGRDAFKVAAEMRRRQLPVDVIYYDDLDEEATDKEFIDALWKQHRVRLTHGFGMPMFGSFKGSDDSKLLTDLAARDFVMVDKDGQPVIGADEHVDSTGRNSAVAYLDYFSKRAVDHIFKAKWNDALENGAILGMVDFGEMDHVRNAENKFWPSLGLSVAQTRNLYGLVYPLAVINGVQQRTRGRITGMVRPGFAGTQRLGWSTTGDSLPTYRNFRAHTRAMLNLTLSGFSNVGQDIGGWDKKGPDILYARWFAAGTFHPFMWSHGQGDHEPYAHGEAVEKAARSFLNLRYRLVPYLYSLHELAHRTGVPVLRSFPLQEPADPSAHHVDDQFFVGDDLMVAPLFNDGGDRKVVLPKGLWYDFFGELAPTTGGGEVERTSVALDRLPVYVRAGGVIPLGPAMQHTGEKPVDPLTVHVYSFGAPEEGVEAREREFALYEDDGLTADYRRRRFQRTSLRFLQAQDSVRFEIRAQSGDGQYWSVSSRGYALHFHGVQRPTQSVRLDGLEIPFAETPNAAAPGASWSLDVNSGDIVVSIPRSASRTFVVEFATEAAWTCAGRC
jgi:alpha-glucosidase